jgi:2-hydroxy-3-oxopropionate reductase
MSDLIGFVGLGVMGRPMAARLSASYEVQGYDVDAGRFEGLARVRQCGSLAEVGGKAPIVCLSLPGSAIVETVILGPKGLRESMPRGSLIIDLSTTEPSLSKKIGAELAEAGIDFTDAPVSGGEKGAVDGTLSIMAGAEEKVFERCRPVFQIIGSSAVRVGPVGAGGVAKLVNNMIVGAEFAAIAEGFALAGRSGIPASVLFEAIRGGWAGSKVLEVSAPAMISRDFRPGGTVGILSKDLGYARNLARELLIPVPVTAAVDEVFTAAKAYGNTDLAQPSMIQMWEQLLGIDVVTGKSTERDAS